MLTLIAFTAVTMSVCYDTYLKGVRNDPDYSRKFGRIRLLFLLLALLLTMAACSGAEPTTEPEAVAPTIESGDDTTCIGR